MSNEGSGSDGASQEPAPGDGAASKLLEVLGEAAESQASPTIPVGDIVGVALKVLISIEGPGRAPVLPHEAFDTTAPQRTETGLVKCDQCKREVVYSTMSIFEFGHLCPRCAATNF